MKKNNIFIKIIFNAKFVAFIGLIIIIAISVPLAKNVSQKKEIDKEIVNLQKEIKEIENKNTDLKKIIDYMGSNQYVEEQARLNFGLKKNGEEAVVIESKETQDLRASIDGGENLSANDNVFNIPGLKNSKPARAKTNPEKWWEYFFE